MHDLYIASLDEITKGQNNDKLTDSPKQNPVSYSHPGSKLIDTVAKDEHYLSPIIPAVSSNLNSIMKLNLSIVQDRKLAYSQSAISYHAVSIPIQSPEAASSYVGPHEPLLPQY